MCYDVLACRHGALLNEKICQGMICLQNNPHDQLTVGANEHSQVCKNAQRTVVIKHMSWLAYTHMYTHMIMSEL